MNRGAVKAPRPSTRYQESLPAILQSSRHLLQIPVQRIDLGDQDSVLETIVESNIVTDASKGG